MVKDTEFKDDSTYIKGKKVQTKWKFVSDGTWFDKDTECILETDCTYTGGIFRGTRTSAGRDKGELQPVGEKYEDGELCHWCEFTIYDETGELIQVPYYGWDGPDGMTFV